MKKILLFTKLTFYFSNVTLLILYLYPGSIIGWLMYDDFQKRYRPAELCIRPFDPER